MPPEARKRAVYRKTRAEVSARHINPVGFDEKTVVVVVEQRFEPIPARRFSFYRYHAPEADRDSGTPRRAFN